MSETQLAVTIGVIAAATMLTRFLPFLCFPPGRQIPDVVRYLGKVLPGAVIGLLVVYCLKDIRLDVYPYGLPQLIAGGCTALLHIWKKNTLLSIGAGTLLYMILVQMVFI